MVNKLTTHVGPLPRMQDVVDYIFAPENDETFDVSGFAPCLATACKESMRKQFEGRVIAGSNFGFGTFAGLGVVDPDIAFAKMRTRVEGKKIESGRL